MPGIQITHKCQKDPVLSPKQASYAATFSHYQSIYQIHSLKMVKPKTIHFSTIAEQEVVHEDGQVHLKRVYNTTFTGSQWKPRPN